jgi:hypothetical protein
LSSIRRLSITGRMLLADQPSFFVECKIAPVNDQSHIEKTLSPFRCEGIVHEKQISDSHIQSYGFRGIAFLRR